MKEIGCRKWLLKLGIVLIILLFCYAKKGYFLDEVYSYGLANSEYAPFITKMLDGDITQKIVPKQELLRYLIVDEDLYSYKSVYYNQTQDVHPPFYYFVMHTICSFFPWTFSKWLGLTINVVFYILSLLLLEKISNIIFQNNLKVTSSIIILYGLSAAGVSTVLFIRMYMMLTFFTLLLIYICLLIIQKENKGLYFTIAFVLCGGTLTHYYYIFYAFFVCAGLVVYLLCKKEYKKCILFGSFALSGVLMAYLIFPSCILHLSRRTGTGTTAMDNLRSIVE